MFSCNIIHSTLEWYINNSYTKAKQMHLTEAPLGTLLKAVCSISEKLFVQIQKLSWKMLLNENCQRVELAGLLVYKLTVKMNL